MAETADLASEIDLEKAAEARREAEQALERASEDADLADLAPAAALLRIRVPSVATARAAMPRSPNVGPMRRGLRGLGRG